MASHGNASDDLLQATLALFTQHICPGGKVIWVADSMKVSWKTAWRGNLDILSLRESPTVGVMGVSGHNLLLIDVLTIRGPMTSERVAQLNEHFSPRMPFKLYTAVWNRTDLSHFSQPPWGSFVWCANEPQHVIEFQ